MSKIKTIHINNFKFFGDSSPIVLDGKNLLLYGENGSGKSSIYNALYTLLEAASKTPDETRKYFVPLTEDNPESLVNIHAPRNAQGDIDSYIEVTDETNKVYRLSLNNIGLCGNDAFKESQRASDFISYKELFLFQLFRNSELSDLHDVFERAVIPYLPCSTYGYRGQKLSSLSSLFASYRDVEAIKDNNPKGKKVIYKNGRKYKTYLALERQINQELRELIEYINAQLSSTIKSFGYTFNAFLRYENQSHKKYDMRLEPIPYKVYLEIDEYNGQHVSIKHPNVFLNEAKMSVLAFAIRWAILTRRPNVEATPDALHVLVLDDIMISLDMGNREKLIKFILTDARAKEYQLLFFTHEHILFEAIYRELGLQYSNSRTKALKDDWAIMEMYEHKIGAKSFPIIQPHLSSYGRALAYFNGSDRPIDYMASGNALRQAIEGEFKRIFQFLHAQNPDGTAIDYNQLMLGGCFSIAKNLFPNHHFPVKIVKKLEDLTWFSLNPLSHDNPHKDFYRTELQAAFDVYKDLLAIEQKVLIKAESELSFAIECKGGIVHQYHMKLYNDLFANIDAQNKMGEILDSAMSLSIWEQGGAACDINSTRFQKIYNETITFCKEKRLEEPIDKSSVIYDEIYYDGKPISQLLQELIDRERKYFHLE